jgi:hypothetical protein
MKTTGSINAFTGILMLAIVLTAGCSALKPIEQASSDRKGWQRLDRASSVYHDFDDVLIPGELKPKRRMSPVSQTGTVSTGLLSLSGKIDRDTLRHFFDSNMLKDNWRRAGGVKAPRSLLLFEKGNRWCVIIMTGDGHGTQVDIWVVPKNN